MPTLEELIKRASKASRKRTRPRAAPLWPMPDDPELLPDPIMTMDFGAAQTVEEMIQATYDARNAALWKCLVLPVEGRETSRLPWAACPPPIWDPNGLLDGQHRDGWAAAHWDCDYFPSPLSGLQHRVQFVGHRFVGHGVAASLLSAAPC